MRGFRSLIRAGGNWFRTSRTRRKGISRRTALRFGRSARSIANRLRSDKGIFVTKESPLRLASHLKLRLRAGKPNSLKINELILKKHVECRLWNKGLAFADTSLALSRRKRSWTGEDRHKHLLASDL
ncbi:protein of unknown function [Pseudomonas mediterranea]